MESKKRVTLLDIANATGYTINTVSRALKNKDDISRETCQRIQEVARSMGYVRNYMAGALRSGRTKTIGLILSEVSNPYYAVMADEIQNVLVSLGYSLMILCSRDDPNLELRVVETAMSRQVDGILLFPCHGSRATIRRMKAAGMPYVLMSRKLKGSPSDSVVCDEEEGAYLACRHLLAAGRRTLGYLSAFDVLYSTEERRKGFLRACNEAGIPKEKQLISLAGGKTKMEKIILDWYGKGLDGLFVFCDIEAWETISVLEQHRIRVPEDVAIVGFDNIQDSLCFPKPICSVDSQIKQVITTAIDLLRKRIHNDEMPLQSITIPAHIVCRGSCGCHSIRK